MCLSNAAVQMSALPIYTTAALLTVTYMSKKKKKAQLVNAYNENFKESHGFVVEDAPVLGCVKRRGLMRKMTSRNTTLIKAFLGHLMQFQVLYWKKIKKNAKVHTNLQHIKK